MFVVIVFLYPYMACGVCRGLTRCAWQQGRRQVLQSKVYPVGSSLSSALGHLAW